MGALWGHFLAQTVTWRAKGASRGACPKIKSRFWTRLGSQNRQKTIKNRCQDAFKFCIGFRIDFGSISDPKSTSKSIQNQSKNSSKINLQTSPISASSSIKFRRQSHVQAKWSMFKNRSKTICFCMFFRHPLMPTKANMRHATHSKIIKNHIQNQ